MDAIVGAARETRVAEQERQARWVALTTLVLHLAILLHDIGTDFRAFTWGDRGMERLRMVKGFAGLQSSPLEWMTQAPVVPGEYLFVVAPWQLGGPAGVILFQIGLAVGAAWLVARMAPRVVPWRHAALVCGLAYALIPQNIAYPHQLVTEAIATPLCVAWLALLLTALRDPRTGLFIAAGICIGIAILIRPIILGVLPIAFVLALLVPAAREHLRRPGLYLMAALGLAPMLLWTAVFTVQTGQFGYNNGSANLSWNMRSRVVITEQAYGIEPPADLLRDDAGISASRYFSEMTAHKAAFAKAFALDFATVFARGNTTKISVDYLGFNRDPAGWRQELLYARDAKQSQRNQTANPVYVIEGIATVLTGLFFAFCFWQAARIGWALMRGRIAASPEFVFLTIIAAAWLIDVFVSGQIVNQAQGRLRNPGEAAFILFAAMAFAWRRDAAAKVTPALPSQ